MYEIDTFVKMGSGMIGIILERNDLFETYTVQNLNGEIEHVLFHDVEELKIYEYTKMKIRLYRFGIFKSENMLISTYLPFHFN